MITYFSTRQSLCRRFCKKFLKFALGQIFTKNVALTSRWTQPMAVRYTIDSKEIDWGLLKLDLEQDDFHNGRTTEGLKDSFLNSQCVVYAMNQQRCVGTARALSDGVCNCYVIDVWTQSQFRNQGVASKMMEMIIASVPGQHIYLQTDDAVGFYQKLGFSPQPEGLHLVSGEWLKS
jgi:ribosomal protein S18 acetylase RimI-like enzyme